MRHRGGMSLRCRSDVAFLHRSDLAGRRRGDVATATSRRHREVQQFSVAFVSQRHRRDFQAMSPNIALATSRRCRNRDVAAMSPPRHRGDIATATSRQHREVQQFSVAFVSQRYRRDFRQCRGDIAATQMRHKILTG